MTTQTILHDFAVKLRELDDRNVTTNGKALALEDPRELRDRIETMAGAGRLLGAMPSVEQAVAVGAYALGLALACARVEELDITSGSEAA